MQTIAGGSGTGVGVGEFEEGGLIATDVESSWDSSEAGTSSPAFLD